MKTLLVYLLALVVSTTSLASAPPSKPYDKFATDMSIDLSDLKDNLNSTIKAHGKSANNHVAFYVFVTDNTGFYGESSNPNLAKKLYGYWKLGRSTTEDVLIVLNIGARKTAIYLEGSYSDILTTSVLDEAADNAKSYFKNGNYVGGILSIKNELTDVINNHYKVIEDKKREESQRATAKAKPVPNVNTTTANTDNSSGVLLRIVLIGILIFLSIYMGYIFIYKDWVKKRKSINLLKKSCEDLIAKLRSDLVKLLNQLKEEELKIILVNPEHYNIHGVNRIPSRLLDVLLSLQTKFDLNFIEGDFEQKEKTIKEWNNLVDKVLAALSSVNSSNDLKSMSYVTQSTIDKIINKWETEYPTNNPAIVSALKEIKTKLVEAKFNSDSKYELLVNTLWYQNVVTQFNDIKAKSDKQLRSIEKDIITITNVKNNRSSIDDIKIKADKELNEYKMLLLSEDVKGTPDKEVLSSYNSLVYNHDQLVNLYLDLSKLEIPKQLSEANSLVLSIETKLSDSQTHLSNLKSYISTELKWIKIYQGRDKYQIVKELNPDSLLEIEKLSTLKGYQGVSSIAETIKNDLYSKVANRLAESTNYDVFRLDRDNIKLVLKKIEQDTYKIRKNLEDNFTTRRPDTSGYSYGTQYDGFLTNIILLDAVHRSSYPSYYQTPSYTSSSSYSSSSSSDSSWDDDNRRRSSYSSSSSSDSDWGSSSSSSWGSSSSSDSSWGSSDSSSSSSSDSSW